MAIVLPHTFVADTDAAASQVNDNFNAVVAALESVGAAAAATDGYQAGVLASTDWAVTAAAGTINGATGALSYPAVGGAAWLPGPSGALVRTFTPVANIGPLVPPVLPGPGGFVKVGVELTASGAAAVPSVVSGVEKASEAEAIAAPPAVSAGKVRVHDVVVKNVAGVYTAVAARDRRPWALGATSVRVTSVSHAEGLSADAGLAQRIECSGVPLRIEFSVEGLTGFGTLKEIVIKVGATELFEVNLDNETINQPIVRELTPAAGSTLVTLLTSISGGTRTLANARLLIREQLRPFANNGTA